MRLVDGGLGTEVAAELADMVRLGVLYVTGNVSSGELENARGHACLAKPYRFADLLRSLEIVVELVDTGRASSPFPDGFRVLPRATDGQLETFHA